VLEYEAAQELVGHRRATVSVVLSNQNGVRLFGAPSDITAGEVLLISQRGRFVCELQSIPLIPDVYEIDIGCAIDKVLRDKLRRAADLTISPTPYHESGLFPASYYGNFLVRYRWSAENTPLGSSDFTSQSENESGAISRPKKLLTVSARTR
jgi:lipopolysaccharide transport system ATP-binding protein